MNNQTNIVKGAFKPDIFSHIKNTIRIWKYRRNAISHLSNLPDRLLEDIGVKRYEIVSTARKTKTHFEIPLKRVEAPGKTNQVAVYSDFQSAA